MINFLALVAELVDALASGASEVFFMWVQIPPRALGDSYKQKTGCGE